MCFCFLFFLQYPVSALVGNSGNISVSVMRIQDCESESTGQVSVFNLYVIIHLSSPKFLQGNSWKASPSAPHLTRNKRHLQGSASHWGDKHRCSVLAHQNKAEGNKEQRINRCTSAQMPPAETTVMSVGYLLRAQLNEFSSYQHLQH